MASLRDRIVAERQRRMVDGAGRRLAREVAALRPTRDPSGRPPLDRSRLPIVGRGRWPTLGRK
jgi:hypothetical protein